MQQPDNPAPPKRGPGPARGGSDETGSDETGSDESEFDADGTRVLAIDLVAGQIAPLMTRPPIACVFARFDQLTGGFLAQVAPDVVLAPLFGADFDVLDLVERLGALAFAGRVLALTPPLPRPEAVRSEVRSHAAGLDFDLLVTPAPGGEAAPA